MFRHACTDQPPARYRTACLLALTTLMLGLLHAEPTRAEQDAIAYASEQTVVVGELDLEAIDLDGLLQGLIEQIERAEVDEHKAERLADFVERSLGRQSVMGGWVANMREAGARRVQFAVDFPDMQRGMPAPTSIVVVQREPGMDVDVVRALLVSGDPAGPVQHERPGASHLEVAELEEAIVLGEASTIERMQAADFQPAPPEALAESFAALEGEPVRVALRPTAAVQQVFAQQFGMMPTPFDPGEQHAPHEWADLLVAAVQEAGLVIQAQEPFAIQLWTAGEDEQTARLFLAFLDNALAWIQEDAAEIEREMFVHARAILEHAEVDGSHVRLDFELDPQDAAVVQTILIPLLDVERSAQRVQSGANARAIAQSSHVWEQTRDDALEDIGALVVHDFIDPVVALGPYRQHRLPDEFREMPDDERRQWINQHTSYVYIPELHDDGNWGRVMVFEKPQTVPDDQPVAYARIDTSTDHATVDELEALLQEQTGKGIAELIQD